MCIEKEFFDVMQSQTAKQNLPSKFNRSGRRRAEKVRREGVQIVNVFCNRTHQTAYVVGIQNLLKNDALLSDSSGFEMIKYAALVRCILPHFDAAGFVSSSVKRL
jgi:hypothetical protein